MANQQLVDYIKGQTVAGVSEPDIKKILKDAGWPDADVEDGLKGAKGGPIQPVVQSAVSPTVTSVSKSVDPVKTEPKKESASFDFMTNPGGMASMSSAGLAKESKPKDSKPLSMSSDVAAPSGGKPSMLPWIVAGVAVLAMLGIGVYFYLQNSSLSSQADTLTAANSALSSELAALKGTPTNVDELNVAKADAAEANSELGLFVIPAVATGTPAATSFDFKGTVGTAKSGYTLTTAKGIVLSVKNSKDAKVEAALKPLIGTTAELAGTHIPGAFDFTLITLNGAALPEIIVATSTPPVGGPVSTSTKPMATSTATSTPR